MWKLAVRMKTSDVVAGRKMKASLCNFLDPKVRQFCQMFSVFHFPDQSQFIWALVCLIVLLWQSAAGQSLGLYLKRRGSNPKLGLKRRPLNNGKVINDHWSLKFWISNQSFLLSTSVKDLLFAASSQTCLPYSLSCTILFLSLFFSSFLSLFIIDVTDWESGVCMNLIKSWNWSDTDSLMQKLLQSEAPFCFVKVLNKMLGSNQPGWCYKEIIWGFHAG